MVKVRGKADPAVSAVKAAVERFSKRHPDVEGVVYRYNSGAIRLRIVTRAFERMDDVARYDKVWPFLEALDEDVVSQVSILLLLTPNEYSAKQSMMNLEFDDPSPSRL